MHKTELEKQIKAYNLKAKLSDLAKKNEDVRPFRHLPKQFSKGILIGNIAIVPKKTHDTRFVYVIANMVEAKILYTDISLKQTAILLAHHIADGKSMPYELMQKDTHFASKIFEIKNFNRMLKEARKSKDEALEFVYENKLRETHRMADSLKQQIQDFFNDTFRINSTK